MPQVPDRITRAVLVRCPVCLFEPGIESLSRFAALGKKSLKLLEQQGEVGLYGLPDDLKIDVAVVVNDAVAHADNLGERDAGKLGAGFGSQAGGGFPGH